MKVSPRLWSVFETKNVKIARANPNRARQIDVGFKPSNYPQFNCSRVSTSRHVRYANHKNAFLKVLRIRRPVHNWRTVPSNRLLNACFNVMHARYESIVPERWSENFASFYIEDMVVEGHLTVSEFKGIVIQVSFAVSFSCLLGIHLKWQSQFATINALFWLIPFYKKNIQDTAWKSRTPRATVRGIR